MDFLLKITEGPMKGAELALVGGTTVSFGSGSDADIVIADSELAPLAARFEVTDTGVTVHGADGKVNALPPFTVMRMGATAFAIGPAEGKWEPLKEQASEEVPAAAAPAAPTVEHKHHPVLATLVTLIVLLALAGGALWYFREPVRPYYVGARGWVMDQFREPPPPPAPELPTLKEIAAEHSLVYTNGVISGNLKRRTERLAIRAMALAVDPAVKFDLTDDETLLQASSALVFACSDNQLRVTSASNRVVTLAGYAPSSLSLEKSLRALNTDVPGLASVNTGKVQVGGEPPALSGEAKAVPTEAKPDVPVRSRPDYPIAGILTAPYPCVVMRNGMRLVEGAQVGTATLIKIEANRLILKENGNEFNWEP